MRRKIVIWLAAVLMACPAIARGQQDATPGDLRREQEQERQSLLREQQEKRKVESGERKEEEGRLIKELEGEPPGQEWKVGGVYKGKMKTEKDKLRDQRYQDNRAFLKERLAGIQELTEAQKDDLMNFFESRYPPDVSFRELPDQENVDFFEKTAADSGMTQEQKKEAIRVHFASRGAEDQAYQQERQSNQQGYRQEQVQERTALKQELKQNLAGAEQGLGRYDRENALAARDRSSEEIHKDNLAFLKERLAGSQNLTEEQKDELANFFESRYPADVSLREQPDRENVDFFEKTAADSSLTQERKKEAIRARFAIQNWENMKYRRLQQLEKKQQEKKGNAPEMENR